MICVRMRFPIGDVQEERFARDTALFGRGEPLYIGVNNKPVPMLRESLVYTCVSLMQCQWYTLLLFTDVLLI